MSTEDRSCKIDSTIPLKEQLESLPSDLQCYESRGMEGDTSYLICGKLTHPLTASLLGEILQEYSGQHPLSYQETFPQCKIPDWFYSVNGSSLTLPLNPSLESMEGWKGIAVCAAFTLHRHPFLILDNLDTNNSQTIECHLGNRNYTCGMTANITEILTFVEGRGFIWILYAARDSILDSILNECNSMTVTFFSNNQDMMVHSCGNQVVFDQNMEELMETIMHCSKTTSESWSSENITRQQSLDDHDHHTPHTTMTTMTAVLAVMTTTTTAMMVAT
ncbi:hypothetical protein M0R45_014267 [Rubus argutus]|uniref:Uncharacterized protein n=1 Tax=Rubus argutus TaxID=59490 RepID=A0AAW1XMF7_RUBAR